MNEPAPRGATSLSDVLPFGPYGLVCPVAANDLAVSFAATFRPAETPLLLALKVFRPEFADEGFVDALLIEARKARRLNHVNVGQTFDIAQHGELLYLTAEFVDGVPVSALQAAAGAGRRPVTAEVAAFIAAEACSGVAYAHARRGDKGQPLGIVHLGITPSRLLLSKSGTVKVIDFGVAQVSIRSNFAAQADPNWLHYAAPESARGESGDAQTDVFGIGAVLHHLLTGEWIYHGRDGTALREAAQIGHVPRVLDTDPSVPPGLAEIVDRCLAAVPEDRYADASEVRTALAGWLRTHAPGFGRHRLKNYLTRLLPDQTYDIFPGERWETLHRKHFALHDPASLLDDEIQPWPGADERTALDAWMDEPVLPNVEGLDLRQMSTGAHPSVRGSSGPSPLARALRESTSGAKRSARANAPAESAARHEPQSSAGAALQQGPLPHSDTPAGPKGADASAPVSSASASESAAAQRPAAERPTQQRLVRTDEVPKVDEPIDFDSFSDAVYEDDDDDLAGLTRAELSGDRSGSSLGVFPVVLTLLLLGGAAFGVYTLVERANASATPTGAANAAQVFVTSRPQGARIFVDGMPGATTPAPVRVGPAGGDIRVELAGYVSPPAERAGGEGPRELVFELSPQPHTLTITSEPPGADVSYLGGSVGATPTELGPLEVDARSGLPLVLRLDGYLEERVEARWEPGRERSTTHVVLTPLAEGSGEEEE